MSTEAQKANLARIRDNQRRSRARRREYLAELEARLRACELQGVEASAEVQVAARRVAEENRQLRELLHKQGLSDEYITHFLQSGASTPHEVNAPLPLAVPSPSHAIQTLQHTLAPRRPASLDSSVSMSMAGQAGRETPGASVSTSGGSSVWDSSSPGVPHYGHSHQPSSSSSIPIAQAQHHIPSAGFPDSLSSRPHPYHGQPQGHIMEDSQHQNYATGPIPVTAAGMTYSVPMNFYHTPTTREYEPRSTC